MLRVLVLLALVASSAAQAVPIVFSASGANSASIVPSRDAFRTAIGGGTSGGANGSFGGLRREINWDGVPDSLSAPNSLPANFFNVNSPRGVVFSTPGTGFQLSANVANPTSSPVQFGNIDASYPGFFEPFSPQRLFTALGSNITDVSFFLPGTTNPAFVSAFGAVFSDVDLANTTSLQFFDPGDALLGTFFALNFSGNETFSFLGVQFTSEQVGRVRITSGNQVLAPGNTAIDSVVMDDFIYSEPRALAAVVPEPGSVALLGVGLAAFAIGWRRQKK